MKLNGPNALEIKKLHEEACALNPENQSFEDKEKNESIKANIKMAWEHFNNSDFEKAIEYFNEALKINPHSVFALLEYGTAFAFRGDFEMAIKKYNEVLTFDKKCADAYYNLGNVYFNLGRLDKALENIEKAFNSDMGHEPTYEAFLQTYEEFDNLKDDALSNDTTLLEQAEFSAKNSMYENCLQFVTAELFFDPENEKARSLYSYALSRLDS